MFRHARLAVVTACCATSAIAIAATPAAAPNSYSQQYARCMASGDAASGVTSAILSCNGTEIDQQDKRLNDAHRAAMLRLTPQKQKSLRSDERAWIKAREKICKRDASEEEGGSLAGMLFSNCILQETTRRAAYLQDYENSPDGKSRR